MVKVCKGCKGCFESGFAEGLIKGKKKGKQEMAEALKKKYDSNWFYLECKSIYGADVIDLLKEFVESIDEEAKK